MPASPAAAILAQGQLPEQGQLFDPPPAAGGGGFEPSVPPPQVFARRILGVNLWGKQEEALAALAQHRRVAVKSGNGLGKGFSAAIAVLWFLRFCNICWVFTAVAARLPVLRTGHCATAPQFGFPNAPLFDCD